MQKIRVCAGGMRVCVCAQHRLFAHLCRRVLVHVCVRVYFYFLTRTKALGTKALLIMAKP